MVNRIVILGAGESGTGAGLLAKVKGFDVFVSDQGLIKEKYKNHPVNTDDGLKIEFDNDWVHLRTSNTEPIIRIYAESNFETTANNIARRLMKDIQEFI